MEFAARKAELHANTEASWNMNYAYAGLLKPLCTPTFFTSSRIKVAPTVYSLTYKQLLENSLDFS